MVVHQGPRVGTAVLLWSILDQGFVLMERVGSHQTGTWSFPGGSVETGELLEDGARREVLEELGVATTRPEYFMMSEDFLEDGGHWLTMYFYAETGGQVRIMEPKKCTRLQFFRDPQAMLKMKLFPGTDRAVTMSWTIVPLRVQALYSRYLNGSKTAT